MNKIIFKDITAQFINRLKMLPVIGQENIYDVIPFRGNVSDAGTPVRAQELNQMQDNIEAAITAKQDKIDYSTSLIVGQIDANLITVKGDNLAIMSSEALSTAREIKAQAESGAFKGDNGVDGHGLSILGIYASLTELQAAHSSGNPGDAYAVGTAAANDLYVWNATAATWQNIGNVLGSWTMNDLCIDAGDWNNNTGGWIMDSLCMDAGNWDSGGGAVSTLAEHAVNADAHSNLIIDGNLN